MFRYTKMILDDRWFVFICFHSILRPLLQYLLNDTKRVFPYLRIFHGQLLKWSAWQLDGSSVGVSLDPELCILWIFAGRLIFNYTAAKETPRVRQLMRTSCRISWVRGSKTCAWGCPGFKARAARCQSSHGHIAHGSMIVEPIPPSFPGASLKNRPPILLVVMDS